MCEPSRPPRLADVAATVAAACGAPRDGLGGEPLMADPAIAGTQPPVALKLASRPA